jgi:hypothetical protein
MTKSDRQMDVLFILWKLLDPKIQEDIREARTEHSQQGKWGDQINTNLPQNLPNKTVGFSDDNKKNEGIPRQYSNPANRITNKTEKEEETVEKSEEEGAENQDEDPDEMNDYDIWNKLMNTVKDMTVEDLYDKFDDCVAKMVTSEMDDDVDVRAHTEFYEVIARLVKGSNLNVSISDNVKVLFQNFRPNFDYCFRECFLYSSPPSHHWINI